jgi:tRNA A-37 threonylcarbamoyl transferase component Bud32
LDEKLKAEILSFCSHIAGSCQIAAAYISGDYALGLPTAKTAIQVLVIIRDFQTRLMNYAKIFGSANAVVFAVDKWIFERDVDRGFLGEALAGGLILPYIPLVNGDYLHVQEVRLKRRLILELLESLVLDFPELSYEFYIEPEYFMDETLLMRARLFPPMMYTLASFMREKEATKNVECALAGFLEALKELEEERVISFSKGYVRISKQFADNARNRKVRFTNLLRTGQRALFTSLLGIFPQILNVLSQNKESFLTLRNFFVDNSELARRIEDPENHVYVPTTTGLTPLANRMDIKAFARKVLSADKDAEVKIENIGGILNDVYLVKAFADGNEKKAVVKRFRDWSNFKWFPLTLWSVGTRTFAVSGSSRLEREYAINQMLHSNGFAVPKVLHLSPGERLIFMEYVEGEDLSRVIKRTANAKTVDEARKGLEIVGRVGELLARVHTLGVALGDTKPENFTIGRNGEIYMMDFEQAGRNGDKVWDVAEFVYYTGHDISPFVETRKVEQIGKAFIMGYLKAGGNVKVVKNAGNPKYTKVFGVFTFPHMMFILSNICRKADKLKE